MVALLTILQASADTKLNIGLDKTKGDPRTLALLLNRQPLYKTHLDQVGGKEAPRMLQELDVDLIDIYDFYYLGVVNIGEDRQAANVTFDTVFNDFWVTSSMCSNCNTTTYTPGISADVLTGTN